ncbi:putative transcription initiation factor [Scheffersomyces stipitis CBS 6054]|uniref:Putative transcription initiation factor n=1 Tax=Scheffersomyces stipitis (strain ATCC 58785 / CBS 6054 / NBRC 10063 / NRRL Y-11545) TaxID=322104 RepID=A3LSC9_PICST|nr:putative transcription initiation factor [Scheffersomyces stipitis CBS 6054]ABN65550.1 putative transcription initiation factor [Scheffersomyces stipitis CBS 6054]
MAVKQIYIARHGYRANWLPLPHPPNPTGIDSDPPLAPHGVEQARQLAAYLTSLPSTDRPQFVVSSPFYRCVETAEPISEMLSLKVVLERGVGEWYRKGRKVIPQPADYDRLTRFFPKVLVDESEWPRDTTVGVIPDPTGESNEDIFVRANEFWKRFLPVFEEKYPDIETIMIITHAATKIALGASLLRLSGVLDYIDDDNNTFRAGACSLDKYVRTSDGWDMKMNGNTEFLAGGEEMHWDFRSTYEAGSDEDIKARAEEAKRKKELQEKKRESDFYVTVDIPMIGKAQNFEDSNNLETPTSKVNIIKPAAQFQITELNNDNPLIKLSNNSTAPGVQDTNNGNDAINSINVIDGKIYETSWKKLVGTDLIFDDYGELIGKVTEHLTVNENVKIVLKDSSKTKEDSDEEEEVDANGDLKTAGQSAFLKHAIKLAKKKEAHS